jgi:hypothetical protein
VTGIIMTMMISEWFAAIETAVERLFCFQVGAVTQTVGCGQPEYGGALPSLPVA